MFLLREILESILLSQSDVAYELNWRNMVGY